MDLTRTHTVNTYEDKVSHYKDCKEQLEMKVMKLEHQLKNKEVRMNDSFENEFCMIRLSLIKSSLNSEHFPQNRMIKGQF